LDIVQERLLPLGSSFPYRFFGKQIS